MSLPRIVFFCALCFFSVVNYASANGLPDADKDGVPDRDEQEIYFTNPDYFDTDNDGYSDFEEINRGFSPHNPKPLRLVDSDVDGDGLSEAWEIKFRSNPLIPDTDGDGYKDGDEADRGFNPSKIGGSRLDISLSVDLERQKLDYLLNGYVWKSFAISSGRPGMATPRGEFKVVNKIAKAWSKTYKLWMPYWLGLNASGIGIHELPLWPSGYREGESHLGHPVSHGCVRLGLEAAPYIYSRIATGTAVIIR